METNEQNQNDADNLLIITSKNDSSKPEKPINDEVNDGYESSEDTGNTSEDLDLEPNDDPNTNLDEADLEALNSQDLDEDETI